MFSLVRSEKIAPPWLLNRNSTIGRCWRSKPTRASSRYLPVMSAVSGTR